MEDEARELEEDSEGLEEEEGAGGLKEESPALGESGSPHPKRKKLDNSKVKVFSME